MRARHRRNLPVTPRGPELDEPVDVNAIVSYNLGAIRNRYGWTQQEFARRLGELTGHQPTGPSISHMERAFCGGRRKRFDAHDIYLLSVVFDVPIVYFFLPPPACVGPTHLADTAAPMANLYAAVLGTDDQLGDVDARLGEATVGDPCVVEAVVGALFGAGPDWIERFRAWRHTRLLKLSREYGGRMVEAAEFLQAFADQLAALGPRAYLSLQQHDLDALLDETAAPAPAPRPVAEPAQPAPEGAGTV